MVIRHIGLAVLASILSIGTAAGADAGPSLLGGRVTYAPPPEETWKEAHGPPGDATATFVRKDEGGAMALQVLPADAQISPQFGPALVRQLRENHKKANQKVTMPPKIESDKRFSLRIHERYQDGQKEYDELHLYRDLGPRVAMVTVNTIVEKDTDAKKELKAGEDVLLSAKWVKKK